MKKFINILLAILTVCSVNYCNIRVGACNTDYLQNLDILEIEKQSSIEVFLPNGVKKKDDIIYLKYNYGQSFSENNYKYKTVRVETTYNDDCGEIIAVAYMEFNFRYNTELNEAKCLSTTHGQICNNSKYGLEVFARTKNLSYESGESFASIRLTKNGMVLKQIDSSGIIFSCDPSGNIIHKVQQV